MIKTCYPHVQVQRCASSGLLRRLLPTGIQVSGLDGLVAQHLLRGIRVTRAALALEYARSAFAPGNACAALALEYARAAFAPGYARSAFCLGYARSAFCSGYARVAFGVRCAN